MSRPKKRPARSRRARSTTLPARRGTSRWAWIGLAAPLLVIGIVVMIGIVTFQPEHGVLGDEAPPFTLPTSAGTEVALDELLAGGNEALLYFSMGVGCDGCFAQIPEVDTALAERGITLVPVMVDPPDAVATESARFGITDPILIDQDRQVSAAYEMLGMYGHSDRPSHSFALVGQDRQVRWVKHYATMFVPADELIGELPDA